MRAFAVALLLLGAHCWAADEENTWNQFLEQAKHVGGPNAIYCGEVAPQASPQRVTACGMEAFKANRPFIAVYQMQGIDSKVAVAVIFDGKKAFGADYDSMGWDTHGLAKDHKVSVGNHVITYPCLSPASFQVTRSGRLACTLPPRKSKPGGIMSPTFEPY